MLSGTISLPPVISSNSVRLEGPDCSQATHLVSAIYLGGFAMAAGEKRQIEGGASVFGASMEARSDAEVESIANEGDAESCRAAQRDRKRDEGCAVPLRIGLMPIHSTSNAAAIGVPPIVPPRSEVAADSPPPTERGHSAIPLVLGGVGVASVGAGVALTLMGKNADEELALCSPNCADDAVSDAETKSTLGTVFLITGIVSIAGGVAWYLIEPTGPKKSSLRLAPAVGTSFAGLTFDGAL